MSKDNPQTIDIDAKREATVADALAADAWEAVAHAGASKAEYEAARPSKAGRG